MKTIRFPLTVLFLTVIVTSLCSRGLYAESQDEKEKKKLEEQEANDAAHEDAEDLKLDTSQAKGFNIHGRLNIAELKEGDPVPSVIGTFTADGGSVYPVKLKEPTMLKMFSRFDNKKVELTGYLRNSGKYLVVVGVVEPPPAKVEKRRRGSI